MNEVIKSDHLDASQQGLVKKMLNAGLSSDFLAAAIAGNRPMLDRAVEDHAIFSDENRNKDKSRKKLQSKHRSPNKLGRCKPVRFKIVDDGQLAFDGDDTLSLHRAIETTGCASAPAAMALVTEMLDMSSEDCINGNIDRINQLVAILHNLDPQDATEGLLCSQMVALNTWVRKMGSLASNAHNSYEIMSDSLKHMEKLMSLSIRQVEALAKYRNKGQQTVTVQHVVVEEGAQAIVGQVGGVKNES